MGTRGFEQGRTVLVVGLAALAFLALAVTGTLPLPSTQSAGAALGCTEYQYATCVDANIEISPATDTNLVGTNHLLTIKVNAVDGPSTIGILGNGTATATIESGPGSFVGPASCSYTGGGATATCTVTITSAAIGTTVVSATSNITVSGQAIPRTTGTAVNTAAGGSGNASKTWTFTPVPHDVDAHLSTDGDITLGRSGTHNTKVMADCKNETPAEMVRCTLQVAGLPAGCTVSSSTTGTPVGGFLLDDTSFYGLDQTKEFDFKLTTTCNPNLGPRVVATLTFKICADGGFIDLANPCVDSDLVVDKSPNVVVRTNKLRR